MIQRVLGRDVQKIARDNDLPIEVVRTIIEFQFLHIARLIEESNTDDIKTFSIIQVPFLGKFVFSPGKVYYYNKRKKEGKLKKLNKLNKIKKEV